MGVRSQEKEEERRRRKKEDFSFTFLLS